MSQPSAYVWVGLCEYPSCKPPSVGLIVAMVCRHYNMPITSVYLRSRQRPIVVARQTAMYLLRKLDKSKSLKDIGRDFGGFDHTTIIHSLTAAQNMIDTMPIHKVAVSIIERDVVEANVISVYKPTHHIN